MHAIPKVSPRRVAPVAVVGVGALFPGSSDRAGFWRDILTGRDLVSEVPPTHWLIDDYFDPDPAAPDKVYAKRGAFLQPTNFNPMEFAIPPSNIPSTDTAQLLALLVAKQVLEDASTSQFAAMDRSRMSVVLGVASATELVTELSARMQRPVWADALRQHGFDSAQVEAICDRISSQYVPWTESSFPGMLGNVVAGRIANRFDLTGTNCVIDAACASSLAALHLALLELESGHSDLVITGGVDALNDILMYTCFSKTPALSPTGDCRPFSEAADGTILGEGLGMLALKRLGDAERDGDRIYAVVRGLGTSSDGLSKSIYAPVAAGQAKALRRAYESAGYGPGTVELLEAHGTGTRAGDLAEFQGLTSVFGTSDVTRKRWCALGSVKSQIGHTKGAAGSAGLIKAVMALHHKVLPPTIKVDQPNPALELAESPFYLNTRARPWIRDEAHPRRASVSSFGFGGSNYHVTLEEYTGPAPRRPKLRTHTHALLLVAADLPAQLIERCRALDLREAHVAHTAHKSLQDWTGGAYRLALVVTADDAAAVMAQALARVEAQPNQSFALPGGNVHYGVGAPIGALGMLFPGQGSQYLDMGRDLAMSFDAARDVWDRATLLGTGSVPLHDVVFPKPVFTEEDRARQQQVLTETAWAQPAIGAVQLSQLAVLRQLGIQAAAVAGHSFGEFTALAAAGCLSPEDLLRVARKRGELMADAASVPGAMTAVMNGPVDLEQQIRSCGFDVVAANRNTPTQVVFSGPLGGIEKLESWLDARKLEFRRLPVSAGFHSPLVQAAVQPLQAFLESIDIRPPTVTAYANATAQAYASTPADIRRQLATQLTAPVRFHEQIDAMYAAGVRIFLEVGPRSTLTAFVDQTLSGRPYLATSLDRMGSDGVLMLCQALAKLAAAGIEMRPGGLWHEYAEPVDPSLQKKSAMSLSISGTNYGRPYPPAPGSPRHVVAPPATPASAQESAPANASAEKGEKEFQQWLSQLHTEAAELAAVAQEAAATLNDLEATLTHTDAPPTSLASAAAPSSATPAIDDDVLRQTLLEVVSEKTGYPTEMLDLSHELESGLGIDSIKRVEILSAFRERLPGLPEVAPSQLAALNTLGDVLRFMQAGAATPSPGATAEPVQTMPAPSPATPAVDDDVLRQTLLEVVSEKTGYPTEMLDLSHELESGLGIDSIKRVEILSAFRERLPGLPEVAPSQLAALNTLGDVLSFMQAGTPAAAVADAAAPQTPATAQVPPSTLARHAVHAVRQAAAGFAMPALMHANTLIGVTDEGQGVAQRLVNALQTNGIRACVVTSPSAVADCTGLIVLSGLKTVSSPEEALQGSRQAFEFVQAMAPCLSTREGLLVTVQDTGGDFGLSGRAGVRAYLGGIAALARTAANEWPQAAVKAIDLEIAGRAPTALAKALLGELLEGGAEREVGLPAYQERLTLSTEPATAPTGLCVIDSQSVVVATGGARGVTALCLQELARLQPRIAILGRTPLDEEPASVRGAQTDADIKRALLAHEAAQGRQLTPMQLTHLAETIQAAREARHHLQAMRDAGARVMYCVADVGNAASVQQAFAQVRQQFGPITCLVHGAGVLADKLIKDKNVAQYDTVFSTKVSGLLNLLNALGNDPLQALVLFSSVAARVGNPGQCDYAMANEALNQVALVEAARRPGCLVRSLGWGPWDGGMVKPGLRAHFDAQGVRLIPGSSGAAAFLAELRTGASATQIVLGTGTPHDLLAGEAGRRGAVTTEVVLSPERYPFLDSHRIGTSPVVPMVLVAEWFIRAAMAWRPGAGLPALQDLRVLRGIVLSGWGQGDSRLRVIARFEPGTGNGLHCEIQSADGHVVHYAATAHFDTPLASPDTDRPSASLEACDIAGPSLYNTPALFHGPDLHAIRRLCGVSLHAVEAQLYGSQALGWNRHHLLLDIAAMDGGLQLALGWIYQSLGAAMLPTRLGELRVKRNEPATEAIRCRLTLRSCDALQAVCDITLTGGEWTVAMTDVSLHARVAVPPAPAMAPAALAAS